ncbi:lipid A-modifier LpxR family protein [Phenylobacterium sp.]|uniref:lipid A-modifier LpxR family protein n=1 Tax=Phenylobacterium sp. TaxID=1871053 RepID=UPI00286B1818|nr:lipid A-modifier LpxR family protein [Phenylobacterium sp.]
MRSLAGLAIVCCFTSAAQAAPDDGAEALMNAAFAPQSRSDDSFQRLMDRDGDLRWRTNEIALAKRANGAVDRLRLSIGETPVPGPVLDLKRVQFEADAYEIAVTRDFAGVKFEAGAYDLHLAPHAGLGVSNAGGQAEAGAVLTVGQRRDDVVKSQLSDMGVQDGAAFGDRGRWYLFAAASGRAVGLNMLRNEGDWDRAGWSTDVSSTLVGDAQVGIGFRKGVMQTSFGLIHREVKGQHRIWGQETKEDTLAAFSLTIRPGQ